METVITELVKLPPCVLALILAILILHKTKGP